MKIHYCITMVGVADEFRILDILSQALPLGVDVSIREVCKPGEHEIASKSEMLKISTRVLNKETGELTNG